MILKLKEFIPEGYKLENKSIPIRVWKKNWPIPKRLKLIKYKIETVNSHKTKIEIIRHDLLGEVKKEFRKSKFKYINLKNKIFIKLLSRCNNLNLNNRNLLFDGRYLRIILKNDEIGVWSLKRSLISFSIIPKTIKTDSKFFELIGILDGEMNKKVRKNRNGQTIKISNSEPKIIKHIVSSLKKYFLIDNQLIRGSITFNTKNTIFKEEKDDISKKVWANLTNIPLENFTKSTICKKYISKKSPIGVLQIRYENSMLFNILINLMKQTRKITYSNENYAISYMRGLAAAEGGVGKVYNRKTGGLSTLSHK